MRFRVRMKFRAFGMTIGVIDRAFDVLNGSVVEIPVFGQEWGAPGFDRAGVAVWVR